MLARPFRPFFICASIFAVLVMAAWLAVFHGLVPAPPGIPPVVWHAHEMVFGYTVAVVAGFLLTAVENWTGRETARGAVLGGLVAAWLLARVLPWLAAPAWLAEVADIGFIVAVALIVARCIHAAGQRRNLGVVVILALFALMHSGFYHAMTGAGAGLGWLQLALGLIVLLIVLIAGRVMPLFTRNAVPGHQPASYPRAATASLLLLGTWLILEAWPGTPGWLRGLAAALLAVLLGVRCSGWFTPAVLANPMLWVLYTGFVWVIAGFGLTALAALHALPGTMATHAFSAGGIGVMTAGMMARVTLGHTGRPISAGGTLAACFILVNISALMRVVAPVMDPHWFGAAITAAALAWMGGFALLAWNIVPLATAPRVDGQPG